MQSAPTNSAVNDILGQARQGSVAAIIQILNERLVDSHIRTRAILVDSVLQLLCEAPTPEDLEKDTVVERVKAILEELAPKHIRKVNINARIVREQQLLWYEEITRDPENQLLWSELIKLKQPNPVQRFVQDLQQPKPRIDIALSDTSSKRSGQAYFLRGLIGGASLCLLLVLLGWVLKHRLGISWARVGAPDGAQVEELASGETATVSQDAFARAVRLAEQAAADGQEAETPAEWLDLAARWQRAADLMAEVSEESENYQTAQDRVASYRANSEQALRQAEKVQEQGDRASDNETD